MVDINYCSSCGQDIKVSRIKGSTFLHDLIESIFQVNHGFFYTLKALWVRPGQSIKDYLEGKRRLYFNPTSYALLLSAIYFIVCELTGTKTYISDFLLGFSDGTTESQDQTNVFKLFSWFAENYAYTVLMLTPVYSLASYVLFKRASFSYLEHFVLNTFIIGQQAIIYLASTLVSLTTGENGVLTHLTIICSMVYGYWVFTQFFCVIGKGSILLRYLCTYVMSLFCFASSLAVFAVFAF